MAEVEYIATLINSRIELFLVYRKVFQKLMYGSFHTCPIMLFLDIFSSLFAKRRRDVKLATEKTVSMIDYGYSRRRESES